MNWAGAWVVMGVTVMLVSPTELLGEEAEDTLGSASTTTYNSTIHTGSEHTLLTVMIESQSTNDVVDNMENFKARCSQKNYFPVFYIH